MKELPSADAVFVKELAFAAGLDAVTVRARLHLWETDPKHPLAIPYLRRLGRPYRIPRKIALEIIGAAEARV